MKKEEHKAILTQIQTATTDVDRMALLMKLEQDYGQVLTERDTAVQEKSEITSERDKYAKLNNELFLQNSAQTKEGKLLTNEDTKEDDIEQHEPQLTYDALAAKFEEEYKEE